jgi:hypothetical protein
VNSYGTKENIKKVDLSKLKLGLYEKGASRKHFCFDNELGHKVYLGDFEISNKLVTNREYFRIYYRWWISRF